MIFLSHNYNDKPIVENFATKLSTVYGMENVFYDSWSIQPGEGIIDKMNKGIEKCKFFFFFVSKNSLDSNMVKLEWQNAIYKATQNKAKLIPVKLDDCLMPAILLQTLYVDVYGKGIEFGIRQVIDIVNNKNTFIPKEQTYENVRGYILESTSTEKEIHIELRAETYVEPVSKYILLFENEENEVEGKCTNNVLIQQVFQNNVNVTDNYSCNGIFFDIVKPTTPGYPIRFYLKSKTNESIRFKGIMRAIGENTIRAIPMIIQ